VEAEAEAEAEAETEAVAVAVLDPDFDTIGGFEGSVKDDFVRVRVLVLDFGKASLTIVSPW